jgi:hypothetical protein
LHVLGLPPAFVLSQDQTLKLKVKIQSLLGGNSLALHINTSFDGDIRRGSKSVLQGPPHNPLTNQPQQVALLKLVDSRFMVMAEKHRS